MAKYDRVIPFPPQLLTVAPTPLRHLVNR